VVSGTILTFRLVARPLCTQPLCETTVTMFGRRPALLAPRQRWRPCCFPGSVPFMTSRPLRLPVPPSSASRHRAPRGGSDRPIAGPNSLEEIADPSYRHRWSKIDHWSGDCEKPAPLVETRDREVRVTPAKVHEVLPWVASFNQRMLRDGCWIVRGMSGVRAAK